VRGWRGEWAATRTRGRLAGGGGGLEMCREGTREIAEGEGACSMACRTGRGSKL